ncbi:YeiH family protein [Tetragenococcus halophilus]|uniref:YeiH family protein n=1 Tax=Tetragenococcus halophilus TaxID=51669 RepID=UPI001F3C0A25|nr:YeiH family protein [Tetragenococcus halophilus]MCF1602735.1 YeiH family protein [Tetragenococcus halophilus]
MSFVKKNYQGILLSFFIALIATFLGQRFSIIGGPVFGILLGLIIALFPRKQMFEPGIAFTSKKILQYAIVLLGFSMNLFQIFAVGSQSLLIIITTIATALIVSYFISKWLKVPTDVSILVGVGSSICGGSAIAATAPVIKAKGEDIATSISVIFLFNVLAAFLFPIFGNILGMNDIGFGMWAGTAINDTSSVVAAGQTWAVSHASDVALNYATIVKLTRTLAIIPITLILAFYRSKKSSAVSVRMSETFPWFILFFLLAAIFSTVFQLNENIVDFLTTLSKFCITMALTAVGLNTNLVQLVKSGGKPILLGFSCWVSIMLVSLLMQQVLGFW